MKRLLTASLLGLALLLPGVALGQTGTITGTVTGEGEQAQQPLPGATVSVIGTEMGTAADAEGNYRITDVPVGEQTLRVSFVGYETVERTVNVPAGETVEVNFELARAVAELEGAVVTGYRSEKQLEVGGATGEISADEISKVQASNPTSALQGTVSGIRVTSQSGQPGSAINVDIRGVGSINAGTQPLFIVDGVQISRDNLFELASGSPLAGLDPSDIENIRVLKGASAAAIYGSQASNGVVIIETKSGSAGNTRVSFSAEFGRVQRIKDVNVMNTEQWAQYNGAAYANTTEALFGVGISPETGRKIAFRNGNPQNCPAGIARFICNNFGNAFLDLGTDTLNTNWPNAVYRKAFTQSYDLTIRGGGENTTFFLSGNYAIDQGQIIDSEFRNGGITAKVDHQHREWLSVTGKVNATTQNIKGTISEGPFINSPFWSAYFAPPNAPIYQDPGNPKSPFNGTPNFVFSFNPVQQEQFNDRQSNLTQVLANTALNWDFGGGFRARTYGGLQYQDTNEKEYEDPRLPAQTAQAFSAFERQVDWNVSQTFTYDGTFSDAHSVSVLLGGEYKQQTEIVASATGNEFPNFLFRNLSTAASAQSVGYFTTQYRTLSAFGNVDYVYDNTYKIGGTLRADGSSRFGENNRYGLFGTVQGYWRLSEEAFLQDLDFLSNLKLRASYGVVGNQNIGNFAARQLFSGGEVYGGAAIKPTQLGNSNLTWESKREINVGLDVSLFQDRISATVDVFRSDYENLLLNRDLPLDSGFGSAISNTGEIRVEGLEFRLQTLNLDFSGFQWRTDFNIAFLDQEVLKTLPGRKEISVDLETDDEGDLGGNVYREGTAPARWELEEYAGVNPANGVPMYYDRNGNLTYQADTEDLKLWGNTRASFYGGLRNTFSYAGLSAQVFFQYDYGRETFNNDALFLRSNNFSYANRSTKMLDYWKKPGDVTDTPQPRVFFNNTFSEAGFPGGAFNSTRYYEDASYIRLKRVRISYSLPSDLLERVGGSFRKLSVYVQGRNLVTWTNYTGFDPEDVGNALGSYPQGKTFAAGIDMTF
ncbi:MAG: SusC/RagA family TonB-linked outer membrane protein [Salinibacter sp.]